MKKALALSLALLLVLALFTGCQKADPAPSDTAPSTNAQTPADSSNTASSEEPYYVAMHIPLTEMCIRDSLNPLICVEAAQFVPRPGHTARQP